MICEYCGSTMEFNRSESVDLETPFEEADAIGNASTSQKAYDFDCTSCGEGNARIKFFSMALRMGGADDKDAVLSFCRDEGLVAIGWGSENDDRNGFESREDYLRDRRDFAGSKRKVKRAIKDFVIWVQPDDVIFLYDKSSSQYYLTQITGKWQCLPSADLPKEKRQLHEKHDVWQWREAKWYPIPRKYLTGDVLSGTPPRPTIQKKDLDQEQAKYLALLLEEPDIDSDVDLTSLQDNLRQQAFGESGGPKRILSPLTSDELETVVVNYVQRRTGAVLMQNTTADDFPDVESLLRTVGEDGRPRTIGTQVKRGGIGKKGDLENFLSNADDLYIYCKGESGIEGATDITAREIAEYMCYFTAELPPTVLLRLDRLYG